jgi:hypothetical protein
LIFKARFLMLEVHHLAIHPILQELLTLLTIIILQAPVVARSVGSTKLRALCRYSASSLATSELWDWLFPH